MNDGETKRRKKNERKKERKELSKFKLFLCILKLIIDSRAD